MRRKDDAYDVDALIVTIQIARVGSAKSSPGLVKKFVVDAGDPAKRGVLREPPPGRKLWRGWLTDIYGNVENSVTFEAEDAPPDLWLLAHALIALHGEEEGHAARVHGLLPPDPDRDGPWGPAQRQERSVAVWKLLSRLGVDVLASTAIDLPTGETEFALPAGTDPAVLLGERGAGLAGEIEELLLPGSTVLVRIASEGAELPTDAGQLNAARRQILGRDARAEEDEA